jgi:hypothetical protein
MFEHTVVARPEQLHCRATLSQDSPSAADHVAQPHGKMVVLQTETAAAQALRMSTPALHLTLKLLSVTDEARPCTQDCR